MSIFRRRNRVYVTRKLFTGLDIRRFFGKNNVENAEKMMNDLGIPLRKFSKGMNSRIGENKISLSGGELQKLAFIKLLLEQKQIYIFDEPTSALDLESEEKMITMLRKYLKIERVSSLLIEKQS